MADLLNLTRGRIPRQGITFLQGLKATSHPLTVQKLYHEKFGVTYNAETLMKYVSSSTHTPKATSTSSYTLENGEIEVSPDGIIASDERGNRVVIPIELFSIEDVMSIVHHAIYSLEDSLEKSRETQRQVEKRLNVLKESLSGF